MFATILAILGSLVPTVLQNSDVIGAGTSNLISNLLGPVETMIANIKAGNTKIDNALAVLAGFSGTITVLKANTKLPPEALAQINDIDLDIQKALSAYAQAEKGYDATIYTPIQPV